MLADSLKTAVESDRRRLRQDQKYASELARVEAESAAGLDPTVTLSFFARFTGRSRPTLYREFGKELPAVIKIGHSSRQLYSVAKLYREGRLPGQPGALLASTVEGALAAAPARAVRSTDGTNNSEIIT